MQAAPADLAYNEDDSRSSEARLDLKLYLTHFLSTWNSRSFEFGAVLFLAAIYPGTLRPLSMYAIIRSCAAIGFASTIGRLIDTRPRLRVVQCSILCGRLSVIASAVLLYALYAFDHLGKRARDALFSIAILLSCVEKVVSVMNTVSIERDWIVVIAGDRDLVLQKLNARMRRIDLVCKTVGPLVIALINGASTTVAIWIMLGFNTLSLPIELICISYVHKAEPKLAQKQQACGLRTRQNMLEPIRHAYTSVKGYLKHEAFLPSFALCLLYLTVLSFSGQMVTYLVASGFSSFIIGLVRTLSTVFELSATWIAPRMMKRITPVRSGMWFLNWQIACLVVTFGSFWAQRDSIKAAAALSAGTILSRVGLWGYDLCAQTIIQEEVKEHERGAFSATEALFQHLFELVTHAMTILLSRPEQFKWPVLVSVVAVVTAGVLYAYALRQRNGHLVSCYVRKVRGKWMQSA